MMTTQGVWLWSYGANANKTINWATQQRKKKTKVHRPTKYAPFCPSVQGHRPECACWIQQRAGLSSGPLKHCRGVIQSLWGGAECKKKKKGQYHTWVKRRKVHALMHVASTATNLCVLAQRASCSQWGRTFYKAGTVLRHSTEQSQASDWCY